MCLLKREREGGRASVRKRRDGSTRREEENALDSDGVFGNLVEELVLLVTGRPEVVERSFVEGKEREL